MALAIKRLLAGDASIGDVKYSYLSEAQFVAENGLGWVLDDGRSIVGSKLHQKYGFATTSDARGLFLRGKNNGRSDGNQDPSGERSVGAIQSHATAKNGLSISESPHSHTVRDASGRTPSLGGGSIAAYGGNIMGATLGGDTLVTLGATTGTTLSAGDAETRPRNMAFNVFVKIN